MTSVKEHIAELRRGEELEREGNPDSKRDKKGSYSTCDASNSTAAFARDIDDIPDIDMTEMDRQFREIVRLLSYAKGDIDRSIE